MTQQTASKNSGKSNRLFSLDALRGLDMMFLTVVAPIIWAIDSIWKLPQALMDQIEHPWEGFTCWDMIMPCFIFMCGAAIPFALEKRLDANGGKPNAAYWKHVLGRVALLWGLGLLVQGRLATFDWNLIRLYDNTLETIAAGYLAVAVTILFKSWKVRIGVPVVCFVVYGLLLHCLGDYSPNGNFAGIVEQSILIKIVPATSETMKEITTVGILADPATIPERIYRFGSEVHYTWYLTTLMCAFMAFAGYFATKILTAAAPEWTKAKRLFAYGAALLALGWLLAFAGVKMVKHIYTVSFTAQAMGWSALLLAALYVLTDIWRLRRGFGLVILFGQYALVAYMIEECFKSVSVAFAKRLFSGVPNFIGTDRYQPLVMALACVGVIIAALLIRRKLKSRT